MATNSGIEWTEATWNPVVGCTKVSPGCTHCYAETMARRLACMADADVEKGVPPSPRKHAYTRAVRYKDGVALPQWNNKAVTVPEALGDPLGWRKPRRIFVCSMSDLFHKDVPFEFIDQVFAVMLACAYFYNYSHDFQLLTKRPERMADYYGHRTPAGHLRAWSEVGDGLVHTDNENVLFSEAVWGHCQHHWNADLTAKDNPGEWGAADNLFPLPNLWLGTSVENQAAADERIPHLLKCPAAVRWLSCEPLLGAVDLRNIRLGMHRGEPHYGDALTGVDPSTTPPTHTTRNGIHWGVIGCESIGSRAGRVEGYEDNARSLIEQFRAAGVPAFHKQMPVNGRVSHDPSEWPEDLRVREYPEVQAGHNDGSKKVGRGA